MATKKKRKCEYCGRGARIAESRVPKMTKDEFVIAAREHDPSCEFIAVHIRPLLGKARDLRLVRGPKR